MRLFKYLIILIIIITATYCHKKVNIPEVVDWSNSRLLEIPQKVRWQQYKRGNLIINPSFEGRKLIRFDSINYTYNISNWKKEGFNVTYIDRKIDSTLPPVVVSNGKRSVLISKSSAEEFLENGDGVTSDFIKVIPGMYDLYFDIKLKNIKPNSSRFSKYLNDAIDVRMFYYDRNKILITPKTKHPEINKVIDNSFKGFSFSHFEKIDSTGWCTVKGCSGYYPFNESIIPDGTKFIKIYIGLKGTGSVLIDNVKLFYSKQNLTPRERSKIYFDSISIGTGLIIPTPQSITYIDSFYFFNPDSGLILEPFILLPKYNNVPKEAINLIKDKIINIFQSSNINNEIDEIKSGSYIPDRYKPNSLIISIGNTDLLKAQLNDSIKNIILNNKDAYYIDFVNDSLKILFIHGYNDRSILYGTETAVQLFQGFKLLSCKIIDYPKIKNRSVIVENNVLNSEFISYSTRYRLNEIYKTGNPLKNKYIKTYPVCSPQNPLPSSYYKNAKKVLYIDDNDNSLPEINNVIKIAKNNNRHLYNLYRNSYEVYFLSPYFSNENIIKNQDLCKLYFNLLTAKKYTEFLWYGSNYKSEYYDDIQMEFFKSFSGKYPHIIDNFQSEKSPSIKKNKYYTNYPDKIVMGNIYDPFDNMRFSNNFSETKLHINSTRIFSLFRLATFGDYLWNPDAYDPDLSLYKVLINEFGLETAKFFYYYNDAYCGLLNTINIIETEGTSNKSIKSAEDEIVMLKIAYEEIKKRIPEETEIIDELFFHKRVLISKYNVVYEKAIVDKKMKEDSSYSTNFIPSN